MKIMLFISLSILAICASQVESVDSKTEKRLLNDGNWMPSAAFGTYMVDLTDRKYMRQAVTWAVKAGYRHVDAAILYASEDLIGEAFYDVIKRGIVKRTELYITTKLSFTVVNRAQVIPAIRNCLKRLQLDYLDLCLIHTPRNVLNIKNRDYLEIWKGLEDAKRMGLTRSIGVSNFNATEINRILVNSKTPPAVNQIETNPTFTNLELVAYCQSKDIVVTGYAPFGFLVERSFNNLTIPPTFDDPILVGMAEKYCVNVSQIVLRYLVECHIIPIAASLDKQHIESNIDIFKFTLSPEDILTINEFDRNIKVHLIDYDGLEQEMLDGFRYLRSYVERSIIRVPIAASLNKDHIESNVDIYDFTMSPEDVCIINEFGKNVEVYSIDYDGLERKMRSDYRFLRRNYIERNMLLQYSNA